MIERRLLIHAVFLTIAPIVVAWYGLSTPAAVLIVLLLLLWRWLIVLSSLATRPKSPDLVLATISISHFVEKVRWCMDRLGVDYLEKTSGGTLGAFFRGRTVPQLRIRTGAVESVIGNSPEILRYLWGRYEYEKGEAAQFLKPTADRIALEERIDRYGVNLQIWIYFHLLDHRDLTLRAWGAENPATPVWQRWLLHLLYPLQVRLIRRAFRITDAAYEKATAAIAALLTELEELLDDGRQSLLGGSELNYTDFAFAALSGPWLWPEGYGAGHADAVRLEHDRLPTGMQDDVAAWTEASPRAVEFIRRLYAEER